jgi:hypothetical protein
VSRSYRRLAAKLWWRRPRPPNSSQSHNHGSKMLKESLGVGPYA